MSKQEPQKVVHEYSLERQEAKLQIAHVREGLLRLNASSYEEAYDEAMELMAKVAESGFSDDCIWIGASEAAESSNSVEVGEAFNDAYSDLHDEYDVIDEEPEETPDEYIRCSHGILQEETGYFRFLKEMPRDDEWRKSRQVAEEMGRNHQTVSTKLADLRNRGAVESKHVPGYGVWYRMTDRGREALEE